MKKISILLLLIIIFGHIAFAEPNDAKSIIEKIDKNMFSKNKVFESTMTIYGRRSTKSIRSKTYSESDKKSFTEYLLPISEKGTKMLKLDNQLWIYSPSTDRIIQISGQMLRQSVMGSDLSYEDMMEDRKLTDIYSSKIVGNEEIDGRKSIIIELTAKVEDIAYFSQKIWVDGERFVPLKQELYGKSGKLLKKVELKDVKQIQGRWFPTRIIYKDMLKEGNGTEFKMNDIKFDQKIPDYIFSKASLKQ